MRIHIRASQYCHRLLRGPRRTVSIGSIVVGIWVSRVRPHIFRPRRCSPRRLSVIHPRSNDNRVRPSKRRHTDGGRRSLMEIIVRDMSRRGGRIRHVHRLLLRSMDCQRLLDLLILLALLALLLALNCPTSFYPFHLLTTLVTNRSGSFRSWTPFLNAFPIFVAADEPTLAANPLSLRIRRWIPTGTQNMGWVVRNVAS